MAGIQATMKTTPSRGLLTWTAAAVAVLGFVLVLSTWLFAGPSASSLNDRPSVVLIRHGDAPGRGEPKGFVLDDCRTQRNLSDKGRKDARALGLVIRQTLVVSKVVSSQWCRARETAELLGVGEVEAAPVFNDLTLNKAREKELLDGERQLIAAWRGPGVLLVVTHSSNIKALTDIDLAEGGMIAVSVRQNQLVTRSFTLDHHEL